MQAYEQLIEQIISLQMKVKNSENIYHYHKGKCDNREEIGLESHRYFMSNCETNRNVLVSELKRTIVELEKIDFK